MTNKYEHILSAIIVDDELLAIEEMETLLKAHCNIKVVGKARNLSDAIRLANLHKPDIIFLDIQLRQESGFDLLPQISPMHKIVFVTAFDQYAIDAFEINATDYLLKPVNPIRLKRTIYRLFENINQTDTQKQELDYNETLFVNHKNTFATIKVNEIKAITADGDYTHIITNKNSYIVLKTLKKWESELPYAHFMRIHRSTIINTEHIDKIEKWFNNTSKLWIKGCKEPFDISQRYTKTLRDKLV